MNQRIRQFAAQAKKAAFDAMKLIADKEQALTVYAETYDSKFAELIIEETLLQVDNQVYGRGENSWYYDEDKKWVRLHFGYGELK